MSNREHTSMCISMPNSLYDRIIALAKEQERTLSFIVAKMVREAFERQEQERVMKDA